MSTNNFFHNYGNSQEQVLYQDLLIEQIKIFGIDMYYLPRHLNNFDKLYGADDLSSFEEAFLIEIYVKSYDGFEGDSDFMSKFGLEIRDRITFTIAKRVFDNEIGAKAALLRPREGDLIYYPLNKKSFEIKFVQNKPIHYPLGDLPTYDMFCELYEYSNEGFNTGIDDIDSIQTNLSSNLLDYALKDEDGNYLVNQNDDYLVRQEFTKQSFDPIMDNTNLNTDSDAILDFTEFNPFSESPNQ